MFADNLTPARLARRGGCPAAPGDMGDDVLVTCDCTGDGCFEVVAGIRSPYVRLPGTAGPGRGLGAQNDWSRTTNTAGNVRLGGEGIFRNAETRRRLFAIRARADRWRWRLHIPQAGTLEGAFEVTVLKASGDAGKGWDFELGSLGRLSFRAR